MALLLIRSIAGGVEKCVGNCETIFYFFPQRHTLSLRSRPLGVVLPAGGLAGHRSRRKLRLTQQRRCVCVRVARLDVNAAVRRSSVAARGDGHLLRHVHMNVSGAPASAPGRSSSNVSSARQRVEPERNNGKEDEVPRIGDRVISGGDRHGLIVSTYDVVRDWRE